MLVATLLITVRKSTYRPTHSRKRPKNEILSYTHIVAAKRFLQKTVLWTVFLLLRLPLLSPKSFTTFWVPPFFTHYSHNKKRFAC